MWNNLRITFKLPTFIVSVAVATGIGIGVTSYQNAASTFANKVNEELSVITDNRVAELKSYLGTIVEDLAITATNDTTARAIADLGAAYRALGPQASAQLKDAYIKSNPHPAGSRQKLDAAATGTAYDKAHAVYHPFLRKLLETRGYYDIFLFDASGELVYTVFKEEDFATNFQSMSAPWAATDLGTVYRSAAAGKAGTIAFTDFKAYAPSANAPASFIATPVIVDNRTVGVLAFQMPVDKINAVMNGKIGLGTTGETMLVGADGLMRSDSSFTSTSDVLSTRVDLELVAAAIRGEHRSGQASGYRATEMTAVAAPLEFLGTRWAVVTVQATEEAFAALSSMRMMMLMVGLGIIAAAGLVGLLVARSLTKPIDSIVKAMTGLAEGNTDINLDAARRGDEIGDMTRAVSVFRDNAIERQRLEAQQALDRARDEERQRRIEALITRFRGDVGGLLSTVDTNMTSMTGVAQMLTKVAEFTTDRAVTCAAASEQASSNVQTVASAAEELSASIQEISRQLGRTTEMVSRATDDARSTNERVAALAASAKRIGDVVELIRAIADQTNLLALNATIEAARAGDAGRGFAVVAQEVKALANQTGKATADIGDQISAIQSETEAAVSAIQAMARMMEDVNGTATNIAAAVEEQEAATQEISRNVQQASIGTRNVASNVSGVSEGAQETRQAAGQVATSSQEAADRARDLRATVDRFLDAVAAA